MPSRPSITSSKEQGLTQATNENQVPAPRPSTGLLGRLFQREFSPSTTPDDKGKPKGSGLDHCPRCKAPDFQGQCFRCWFGMGIGLNRLRKPVFLPQLEDQEALQYGQYSASQDVAEDMPAERAQPRPSLK
ncbi:hypothetical protein B0O99DRAFT_683482 [Bisporella sp. PMI_857]|nr:hypothetical protein B0O99DRAFT_683482 [Bisporella sp. PMI_857]